MQGQSRERALQGLLRLVLLVSGRSSSTGQAASRHELSLVPATAAVALHARQQCLYSAEQRARHFRYPKAATSSRQLCPRHQHLIPEQTRDEKPEIHPSSHEISIDKRKSENKEEQKRSFNVIGFSVS